MFVIRITLLALLLGLGLPVGVAHAMDCSGLPTSFNGNQFPAGDFFANFNNPCYTIGLATGYGSIEYGDTNAVYYQIYFQVDPRYQLILLGDFPNTRYFSVSLNDAHSALSGSILDTSIVPLTSHYINPYMPGVSYLAGQQYAVPINFGGTPGKLQTGCKMNGYNVDVNGLDATQRHPGMDWNSDNGFFNAFPGMGNHVVDTPQHTNPNTAGLIMVRAYVNDSEGDPTTSPQIIVRDVASGCAYPAAYALNTLQIVAQSSAGGGGWLDSSQYYGHHTYETSYLPKLCDASPVSSNKLRWSREPEYVPATNPNAAYIVAGVNPGLPANLAAAGEVMRIRLRIPTTPPTPCTDGCSRTGNEEMRYMSLSFVDGGLTMTSLADTAFTKDSNGYATLIVGTGAAIPSWITPANGYTFVDLTTFSGYQQLSLLALRNIIPNDTFKCTGQLVPYRTAVDMPLGSLLGDYTPIVDYPTAASLPKKTSPLTVPSACGLFPIGDPGDLPKCGVLTAPAPYISSVVTECQAPGCTQFAAQTNPPFTVIGQGFGVFPDGTPYTGDMKYLAIEDLTRNWIAGYNGTECTISISSWDIGRIQFVANVSPNGTKGKCPLLSGDQMKIEVWNPQTMLTATFKTTAQ